MSEQKPQYLIDAESMMQPSVEIHPQTTVIKRRGNKLHEEIVPAFVKITTDFKNEMAELEPYALKVWLFLALSINRNTEEAHPGIRTIAKQCGISPNTVMEKIKDLEERGLIQVDREEKKYNIYQFPDYVSANSKTVSLGDTSVSVEAQSVSPKPQTVPSDKGLTRGTREPEEPDRSSFKEKPNPLENAPLDWLIKGGASKEELQRLRAKEVAQKEVTDHYERKMGYNVLPWDSEKDLEALRRFLMTKTKDEIDQFAEWSKAKFCPLSPAKARQKPRLVIECWPQAVQERQTDPRIKLWVDGKPVE